MRRLLPLISIASIAASLTTGRAAVDSDSATVPPADEETRALRQLLFKKPLVPFFDPQRRTVTSRGPERPAQQQPAQPPAPRPLVITPPPAPREISLAERELSLQPTTDTPYDRYSGSVRAVISRVERRPASMARVRALMSEAHAFHYRSADPYRAALPETTAATHTGDCKAKALWLYDQLGDPSALYVIGKTFKGTKSNHAWLYWRCDSRWWILDPTNRSTPIAADSLPENRYEPWYSFGKEGAYRHRVTWIFMAGSPPVATPNAKASVARQ